MHVYGATGLLLAGQIVAQIAEEDLPRELGKYPWRASMEDCNAYGRFALTQLETVTVKPKKKLAITILVQVCIYCPVNIFSQSNDFYSNQMSHTI